MYVPPATCAQCEDCHYDVTAGPEFAIARRCPSCFRICPECNGSRQVIKVEGGVEKVAGCSCRRFDAKLRMYNSAEVPSRLAYCQLDIAGTKRPGCFRPMNKEQHNAHERVKDFARTYVPGLAAQRGLLLMGKVGVGKSHLLAGTVRYLALEKGLRCRYAELFFIFSEIRQAYGTGKSDLDVLRPLLDVDVLVLDELGKGRCSEFEQLVLDEIISRRYNGNLTTLLASNYTDDPATTYRSPALADAIAGKVIEAETLALRTGERIYSRLRDMCEFVPIVGDDYRLSQPRH